MRICLVSETLFPVSGTSSRTLNLARALARRGHYVWVIAPKETQDAPLVERKQGFCIRRLKICMPQKYGVQRRNAYLRFLIEGGATRLFSEVLKVSSSMEADAIHYVNYYMSMFGFAFRRVLKNSIYDLQASAFLESHNMLNKIMATCVESLICNSGIRMIVPTEELRAYFVHRFVKHENLVDVVPLCIDVKAFSSGSTDKNQIRQRLRLSKGDRLLVFHGSPYRSNIEALKRLKSVVHRLNAKGISVRVLVMGLVGQLVSSPYFLNQGYVENLAQLISSADLAVLPVDASSLGMRTRILEYMSCGVPVVALSNGVCGYKKGLNQQILVADRSLEGLVKSSLVLLLDPILRNKIAENALKFVEKYHSSKSIAIQLESIYKEFVEK